MNGNLVNKIINSPVCLAFEEQNSATDFYDSYNTQLNDNCFNNPNVHRYHHRFSIKIHSPNWWKDGSWKKTKYLFSRTFFKRQCEAVDIAPCRIAPT